MTFCLMRMPTRSSPCNGGVPATIRGATRRQARLRGLLPCPSSPRIGGRDDELRIRGKFGALEALAGAAAEAAMREDLRVGLMLHTDPTLEVGVRRDGGDVGRLLARHSVVDASF